MGIDTVTNQPIFIDYAHHEIHGGSSFISTSSAVVASSGTHELRFAAGSGTKRVHMTVEVDASASADVDLFEGTSKTDVVGNRVLAINRKRDEGNSTLLTVCHTPAGSGDGDQIFGPVLLGTNVGASSGGGNFAGRNEFILKPDTAYLMRITSNANGNRITVYLDWYEHSHKG